MENNQTNIPVESTTDNTTSTGNSSHHHSSHHHSSHHHRHSSSSHGHRHSSHRHQSIFRKLFSVGGSSSSKRSSSKVKSYAVFFLLLISVLVPFFPDGLLGKLIRGQPTSGMAFEDIFTYFEPIGSGSTNFGPFLLTIVCIVLLAMSIVQLTRRRSLIIKRMLPIVSVIALVIALMPLILDVGSLSITGIIVSLLLALVFWLSCNNPFEKR